MKTVLTATLLLVAFATSSASAQVGIRIGNVQFSTGATPIGRHIAVTSPYVNPRVIATQPTQYANSTASFNNYPVLTQRLYGQWHVQANHVTAALQLGPNGFFMNTGQIQESGMWDKQSFGHGNFGITLHSSLRGTTQFQAQWIVPGRQFQMVSTASGVTYTVTRSN